MSNFSQQVIYNASHNLDALCTTGVHYQKALSIKIIRREQYLQVQVHDCNDYLFNYTANIDRATFDQMKLEQSLDISYDELAGQLLDLLQHTANKDMLIRLEYGEHFCKLIFYEKIRIKSLIFLTIELQVTNQREIINEMSLYIIQIKDSNKNLLFQVNTANNALVERDKLLKSSLIANKNMESTFTKDLSLLEKCFSTIATKLENTITDKLLILSQKYFILIRNIEAIKLEQRLKNDASIRLSQFVKNLRRDRDKDCNTISDLKLQLSTLKDIKDHSERGRQEYKTIVEKLQGENVDLNGKMGELHKDLKEATFIIAQKTMTHEEMAKDLVQANTMLVNFTNHYDNLTKEVITVKAALSQKEREFDDKSRQYNDLESTFDKYKNTFSRDDLENMKRKLFHTKKLCEELEKKNREANKLNALLSRKVAECGDSASADNGNASTKSTNINNTKIGNHTPWLPKGHF